MRSEDQRKPGSYRIGRDRPDKRRSYGLGLAICRSTVHEHGGRLFYEHRNGRGARFVAQFPRTTTPPS